VAGGFHIVGHVADEGGLGGGEAVGCEDAVDDFPLVEDTGVGGLEMLTQAEFVHLALKGEGIHGGEDKAADAEGGAPFEFFAGVGENGDGSQGVVESRAEVGFEFFQRNVGQQFGVKFAVGEAEDAAESFAVERSDLIFPEDGIGRLDDGAEIVDQGAGPIENEVAKHGRSIRVET